MQRISLAWFANLGAILSPIAQADNASGIAVHDIYRLQSLLTPLASAQLYPLDIKASRPAINELLGVVQRILSAPWDEQAAKLENERFAVWLIAKKLEPLLLGELAVQPVYHVWRKRAYDIEALVAEGETLFSAEVRSVLNDDELYNIREAARCLAFEIPTAAAFHLLRCAESIIRRYYEVVVGTLPTPKMRNWGAYIRNLKKCNVDVRITSILEQVKDLHRNPVIHPEQRLDVEEACSLIAIVDSAILVVVRDMKKRLEHPQLPLVHPPDQVPTSGPVEQAPAS